MHTGTLDLYSYTQMKMKTSTEKLTSQPWTWA
jgi:hypothetical protein